MMLLTVLAKKTAALVNKRRSSRVSKQYHVHGNDGNTIKNGCCSGEDEMAFRVDAARVQDEIVSKKTCQDLCYSGAR